MEENDDPIGPKLEKLFGGLILLLVGVVVAYGIARMFFHYAYNVELPNPFHWSP